MKSLRLPQVQQQPCFVNGSLLCQLCYNSFDQMAAEAAVQPSSTLRCTVFLGFDSKNWPNFLLLHTLTLQQAAAEPAGPSVTTNTAGSNSRIAPAPIAPNCRSNDPQFQRQAVFNNGTVTLYWSLIDNSSAVKMKLIYSGAASWLGVGFTETYSAAVADAVIGVKGSGVGTYTLQASLST
jgi:hypothetical protein